MAINLGGRRFTAVVAVLAAAAVGFLIVVAFMRGSRDGAEHARDTAPQSQAAQSNDQRQDARTSDAAANANANTQTQTNDRAAPSPQRQPGGAQDDSLLSHLIGGEQSPAQSNMPRDWLTTLAAVTIRLTLAALLAAMLAFRPRRFTLHFQRNPYVAQTQILLSVTASALMMIVGDSTARAFGIFGAASLVRFRTNIKDPKEISVLLISLAIGLSTGVGRVELGIILSLFVLLLLWGLEYREAEQVTRALELTVKTRNIGTTQDALLALFRKYDFDAEMRTIDRPDEKDSMGIIVYYMNVNPSASLDRLSQEILSADPKNVDSVEWDQQKNSSYFYQ
ncbi:MAG TPA: DUF4956 domain-containing protein [Pyrinomonadaceae bacterium]|nr:DUF4956 domain-containing protein [Pyrinomonadaceae bacterium]